MYKLYVGERDISDYVGSISWNSSIDNLSDCVNFSVANDNVYNNLNIELGDIITLTYNSNVAFEGIILEKTTKGNKEDTLIAYDYAIYLAKSTITKQFNNISSKSAISSICSEAGIIVSECPNLTTIINHVYYNQTLSNIMDDILTQCSNENSTIYYKEVVGSELFIFERGSKRITPSFKPASNLASTNPLKHISDSFTKSESVTDMKNKVVVSSHIDDVVQIHATEQDITNISKFGLMQHTEFVDEKDISQSKNIAKNKLNEYNKISKSISFEVLGDIQIKAGRLIELADEQVYVGEFIITSVNNTLNNQIHLCKIEVEEL